MCFIIPLYVYWHMVVFYFNRIARLVTENAPQLI